MSAQVYTATGVKASSLLLLAWGGRRRGRGGHGLVEDWLGHHGPRDGIGWGKGIGSTLLLCVGHGHCGLLAGVIAAAGGGRRGRSLCIRQSTVVPRPIGEGGCGRRHRAEAARGSSTGTAAGGVARIAIAHPLVLGRGRLRAGAPAARAIGPVPVTVAPAALSATITTKAAIRAAVVIMVPVALTACRRERSR